MLPAWAFDLISRQVDAYLAGETTWPTDPPYREVAGRLRAWMVYGDMGGVLLLSTGGEIYCLPHDAAEPYVETDPRWRLIAWFCAAELAPELKALLPAPPNRQPDCPDCAGTGRVLYTPQSNAMPCRSCWGSNVNLPGQPTE